jgi:uncharacterized membrane protein YphA (DoxX/SURF4 family)
MDQFPAPQNLVALAGRVLLATGGFLVLAGFGPGAWSLDAWLRARRGTGGEIAR